MPRIGHRPLAFLQINQDVTHGGGEFAR